MKTRSLLLGLAIGLGVIATEVHVQAHSDAALDVEQGLPCNGYPEYKDLPANHFFWLGARISGSAEQDTADSSHSETSCLHTTQDRTVTDILKDGIRLLEIDLCKNPDAKLSLCYAGTDGTTHVGEPLHGLLDSVFEFANSVPHQVIVVHFSLKSSTDRKVELQDIVDTVDVVCKLHSERTPGIDAFEKGKCPFIYTQKSRSPWLSMGGIANYDPDMAQWEGDGDIVGVRSRIILTHANDIVPKQGGKALYFTETFWRASYQLDQQPENLKEALHKLCQTPGATGIDAYFSTQQNECLKRVNNKIYSPNFIETSILGTDSCNLDQAPSGTFINKLTVDFYNDHLPYLLNLQKRMLALNLAKFQGQPKRLARSAYSNMPETSTARWERDEL